MAIINRMSGAEKELLILAMDYDFKFQNFQEIIDFKELLEISFSAEVVKARNDIEVEIRKLNKKCNEINIDIENKSRTIMREINCETERLESEIDALKIEFTLTNLFSYIGYYFERRSKKNRYNYLKQPEKEIRKRLNLEYQEFDKLNQRQNYLSQKPQEEIKQRLSRLIDKKARINRLVNSKEYPGAWGEVEVINQLKKLPDEYYVFNDLYLELEDWTKHDDSHLRTARIDHLVIGPTGVYVIETKNWSEKMVREAFNNSYPPYKQVKRASRIVYRKLNYWKYRSTLKKVLHGFGGEEIKVSSIVAVCGSVFPPPPENSYINVMRPGRIPNFILRGGKRFSPNGVKTVLKILSREF